MNRWPRNILISLVFILIFSGIAYWGYKRIREGRKVNEKTYQELVNNPEELAKSDIDVRDESEFRRDIHAMANTVIIPVDGEKWGNIPITPEKCYALILEAMKSDYKYKNDYIKILERWENGDLSKAVEDHNFVWDLLGGTKGKAVELSKP